MTGREIKEIRNLLGMNQDRFGIILGVSYVTIFRWERGVVEPSLYRMLLIRAFKEAHRKCKTISEEANITMSQYGVIKALYVLLKAAVEPSLQEVMQELTDKARSRLTEKEKKVLVSRFGFGDKPMPTGSDK